MNIGRLQINPAFTLTIVLGALVTYALGMISESNIGDEVTSKVDVPLTFKMREFFDSDPSLDSKIKVFELDDATIEKTGIRTLDLKTLADLIKSFDEADAAAILIDSHLENPAGMEHADYFNQVLEDIDIPVVVGGFVTDASINWLPSISVRHPDFPKLRRKYFKNKEFTRSNLYGPHKAIRKNLKVASMVYKSGYKTDIITAIGGRRVILSWGIAPLKNIRFNNSSILANDIEIPVDDSGKTLVNVLSEEKIAYGTSSLSVPLSSIKSDRKITNVSSGDYVVILPNAYHGGKKMVPTPFGYASSGNILVSVLNSAIKGSWIVQLKTDKIILAIVAMVGWMLAYYLSVITFTVAFLGVLTFILIESIGSFVISSYSVPWFFPTLNYVAVSLITFTIKSFERERESKKIVDSFRGMLSEKRIAELISSNTQIDLAPKNCEVSIMFVDIVGFSMVTDKVTSDIAFAELKRLLTNIKQIIHKYDGVIDRSLGDGLLSYFGYHYSGKSNVNHADQAIHCAIEVQRRILEYNINASNHGRPVLPLRIGINTDSVIIGDLGDEHKMDFTVIGSGVNFAQRLEASCESNSVMIGKPTYDAASGFDMEGIDVQKRMIQIKHHDGIFEAYEIDPFASERFLRAQANKLYRNFANIQRVNNRWHMTNLKACAVYCSLGKGYLYDISEHGLGIILPEFAAKGVGILITIGDEGSQISRRLKQEKMNPLYCTVKWGRPLGANYLHGLEIRDLHSHDAERFIQIFEELFELKKLVESDDVA